MKKQVTVYYRKLDRSNIQFPDITFEDALKKAMDKVENNWQSRTMAMPQAYTCFTNHYSKLSKGIFGDLCAFSQARMQALIKTAGQTQQSSVDVREMQAPSGQDFLLGMAHWLVIDDHVLLVQGAHLYARQINEYFDWLLRTATATIPGDQVIPLAGIFDVAEVGNLEDVESIEIGGTVASNLSGKTLEAKPEIKKVDASKWARDIFKTIFGEAELAQLNSSLPNDVDLKAKVIFSYSKYRRKIDANTLENLGAALQDLPDSQVRVKGKGGTVSDKDARLYMKMGIDRVNENGVLLDPKDTCGVLVRVYTRFVEDEKIS